MDSGKSPTGSVKRHRPRRSTRGPLDAVDDPLAERPKSPSVASTHSAERASVEIVDSKPPPPPPPEDTRSSTIDLSFLQDRANYLQIPTDDIPQAFLDSPHQPPAGTSLPDLLKHGLFRRAAQTALEELLQCSSDETKRILELFYTRLACLTLISKPEIASHESAVLTDFLARSALGAEELLSVIPWELRLLLVRLQTISAPDGGRRGIMSLYALAAEVRQRIKAAATNAVGDEEIKMWSSRLSDLGLRVVDMLVEMGELETAARHLETLVGVDEHEIAYRKALLRIRIGDTNGAKRCIKNLEDEATTSCVEAVVEMADGHFQKAVEQWRKLSDDTPNQPLFGSNLAVGLLYIGRISEAKGIFEDLAKQSPAFPGLLFNIGTVYELCTEDAVRRKTELAQNLADRQPAPDAGGWERENFEFKL